MNLLKKQSSESLFSEVLDSVDSEPTTIFNAAKNIYDKFRFLWKYLAIHVHELRKIAIADRPISC